MGEHFVMPSIRSREVACAERPRIRRSEDTLKALDFGNGLLSVHSVSISDMRRTHWQVPKIRASTP
jgi:hypothetical protein